MKKSVRIKRMKKSIKRRSYKKSIKRRSCKKSIKKRYDGTLGSIQIKLKPLMDAVFYYNNPYFTKTLKFFYNIDNNSIGILIKQFFTFENDSILLKNETLIEFIIKFDLLNDILPLLKSDDITVKLCNHNDIQSKFSQADHENLINKFHHCFEKEDPFNCLKESTTYSKKSKAFLKNAKPEFITILNYVMIFFKEKTIREKIINPYKIFYVINDSEEDVLMNFIFSLSKILYKMYCVRDIYTSHKIIDYVILHCINNLNRIRVTVMFITDDLTEPEKQLCNERNIFTFVDTTKKYIPFAYLRQLKYKTQQFSTCGETTLLNLFNLLLLKEDLNTFDTTNIIEAHEDLKNFYINYNSIEKQTKHIDPEKIIDNINDTTRAWLDVVSNIDSLKIYTEIGDIRNSKQNILNCLNYLLKKEFVSIKDVVTSLNPNAVFAIIKEDTDSMEFTITFNEYQKYEGYFRPGHAELNISVKKTEIGYSKKFEKFTDEKMFLDIMTYIQTKIRNGYELESEITRIIITMFYDHCQNKYTTEEEFIYDKIIDQILNNFVKPITIFKLTSDSGVDYKILVHFFKNYKYILDKMPNITSMYLNGVWYKLITYCITHDFQPILNFIFNKYHLKILDIRSNDVDNIDNMKNNENLEILYISNNRKIKNLNSLSTAKKLKTLIATSNKNIILNPLLNLEINKINLRYCNGPLIMSNLSSISDESPLVKSLIDLDLSMSDIIDISLLEKFKMLKTLNLSDNPIYDMTLLSTLENLEKLNLSDMSYIKMTPLNNSKLVELNLENSNINSFVFLNDMYSNSLEKLILNGAKTFHPINNNDLLPNCNRATTNVTELKTENTKIDRKDDIKKYFPKLLS